MQNDGFWGCLGGVHRVVRGALRGVLLTSQFALRFVVLLITRVMTPFTIVTISVACATGPVIPSWRCQLACTLSTTGFILRAPSKGQRYCSRIVLPVCYNSSVNSAVDDAFSPLLKALAS
ncbi:hypothetical protein V7S43_007958 [Phytophthora oleae]|uniref:Uncharacterized protein n=1 Tax=Phytophthora oleae TaxID=2107226 RepID=A0ABD3FJT8_9STRA